MRTISEFINLRKSLSAVFATLFLCLAVLIFAGCGNDDGSKAKAFRLGIIPSENAQETQKSFAPLVSYLEKTMNVKIEASVATDYNAVVEAMRAGHLDAAMFGPFSYVMANERAGAQVVVARVGVTGLPTYKSYIYTRSDSGINSLQDLKGKSFAFTDPGSASGYLIPSKVFLDNKMSSKDFSSTIYTNGQDASVLAVKNKSVDAACGDEMTWERSISAGIVGKDELKSLASADIPQSPFAVSKDISPEMKKKFVDAMLKVGKEAPETLKPLKAKGYVETTDDNYKIIRDTAKALNLDLSKMK